MSNIQIVLSIISTLQIYESKSSIIWKISKQKIVILLQKQGLQYKEDHTRYVLLSTVIQ